MEVGLPIPELRSLEPIKALSPVYTIQQYASHKTYK